MKKIFFLLINLMALLVIDLCAQIRVVVADFKNESDAIYLDSWERSIPDLLRTELSHASDIVVLERDKLDAIFEEQKLALAGFVEDSALVQQVGNLMGAEVIIYGAIHKIDNKYRIDTRITRVKNQQVRSEIVEAPDAQHLKKMIDLLQNNIYYQLTGKGEYKENVSINRYPTKYFLAVTAGFAVATILSIDKYQENWDNYQNTTQLDKFDSYYDKANNARKLSGVFASLGAGALAGTLYCWIGNMATDDITARPDKEINITPGIGLLGKKEVMLSVQIRF